MKACTNCSNAYSSEYRHCPECLMESTETTKTIVPDEIKEESCKYPMVAWISKLTKVLSCIALVLGIALAVMGKGGETMMGIVVTASALGIYISASVIQILIDIEKNTRQNPRTT